VSEPRILLYDIETTPNLGYIWGKWQQNVVAFEREWFILSAAWKWLGEKRIYSTSLPEYVLYDTDPYDDFGVVSELWELFNQADIVVAHNGDHFDQPKTRTRMAVHNMPPPEPFLEIDTLKLAKKHFKFTSNRLEDLAKALDVARKGSAGGIDTWLGCMSGDEKAWRQMVRYNKQDVTVLEDVYLRLRPWAKQHPNLALLSDKPKACPKCGVEGQMEPRGWIANSVTRRRRYRCGACTAWSAGRTLHKSEVGFIN
jgi:hypothetical protein